MGEFDDIIPEYIAESSDLLQTVEQGLLKLESGQVDEEAIHTIFRAIHSIKGGAGFVGLTKIEHLAHHMEDVLNLIRNGDLVATPPITDALLQALDVLTDLFNRVDAHAEIDVEGPIRALDAALQPSLGPEVRQDLASTGSPDPGSGLPRFAVSEYSLKKKLGQGNLYYIKLDLAQIESRGLTPLQLVNEMLSMGEILDSLVELEETGDQKTYEVKGVSFHVLYFTVLEGDLLEAALRLHADEYRTVADKDFGFSAKPASPAAASPAAEPAPTVSQPAAPAREEGRPGGQVPAVAAPAAPAVPAAPTAAPAQALIQSEAKRRGGEYLTFTLGPEEYAVDILAVQEIIGLPDLTRLPRSPEYVLGVMNLRGMVVPVFDLRKKLSLATRNEGEPVVVVLHVGEKVMGAVVDGVKDVIELEEEAVQDAPDFVGAVRKEFLRGLARHEGELVILLEMDRLLAPEALGHAA